MALTLRTMGSSSARDLAAFMGRTLVPVGDSEAIPRIGICLEAIHTFIQSCGGADVLQGLTTSMVCERFMKKMTEAARSSYCAQLALAEGSLVDRERSTGPATAFVSHAWSYLFLDVVGALDEWVAADSGSSAADTNASASRNSTEVSMRSSAENSPRQQTPRSLNIKRAGVFFWFDIVSTFPSLLHILSAPYHFYASSLQFSNSQHDIISKPFSWWTTVFEQNVRKCERMLLVLQWADPIPLRRAWCIWEIACALSTHGNLQIIMTKTAHKGFLKVLNEDFDALATKLCSIDVATAAAQDPVDKSNIMVASSSFRCA